MFVADTRRRLAGLSTVEIENSRGHVQVEAHSLKSTAAMFGLRRFSMLARHLESSAMSISQQDFLAAVPGLEAAFAHGLARFDETFKMAA